MTLTAACAFSVASGTWANSNGKERDTESGNDYFGARYYASSMGRFMSPDPSGLTYASPNNPQSLNLYAYANNNPLVNIDPTGLDCVYLSDDARSIEEVDADSDTSESDCNASGGTHVKGSLTGYGSSAPDGTIDEFYSNNYSSQNQSQNGMPNPSTDFGFWAYLSAFLKGNGPDNVFYTADNPATKEMQNTNNVAAVKSQYIDDRCPSSATLGQCSLPAAWDSFTEGPPSGTQIEVGGYGGTISTTGNTTTFTINNASSWSSFNAQSALFNSHSSDNPAGPAGPGQTVNQTFQWTEIALCHR